MLGPDGAGIVSSGDKVEDAAARKRFIDAYHAKHQISMEGAQKPVLVIGEEDWPFPIPIVRKGDNWRFDTAAGRDEILYRRIGRNERAAIQASLAYVDAQNDYADVTRATTGTAAYARRIVSQPGKKDGLYWPTEADESPSPPGELAASAISRLNCKPKSSFFVISSIFCAIDRRSACPLARSIAWYFARSIACLRQCSMR